jgi:hypothetical protein
MLRLHNGCNLVNLLDILLNISLSEVVVVLEVLQLEVQVVAQVELVAY